jgi:hypothetical protein
MGAIYEEGGEVVVHLLGVALEIELEADHDPPWRTVPVSCGSAFPLEEY